MSSSKNSVFKSWGLLSPTQLREQFNNTTVQISATNPHSDVNGIGVEIEVERVHAAYEGLSAAIKRREIEPYWKVTTDGSLRDGGLEFVSWVGMNLTEVMEGVYRLNALFKNCGWDFSPRCGLHVHFAFNGSSTDDIKNFFMLYGLFENCLFSISGKRQENKYCCPVRESNTQFQGILQSKDHKEMYKQLRFGQKYLAFNYKPLLSYGTIEFRHHYGTADPEVIGNWVETINCLYKYAHNKTFDEIKAEITELNTISSYGRYAEQVFGSRAKQFDESLLQLDMREGCLFIKECLTEVETNEESHPLAEAAMEGLRLMEAAPQQAPRRRPAPLEITDEGLGINQFLVRNR